MRLPMPMSTKQAAIRTASAARQNLPICIFDEDAETVELLQAQLARMDFPAVGCTQPAQVLEKVRAGLCRVVLAHVNTPGGEGLTFLDEVLQADPGAYVILITGYYSVDAAIEAIKRGAYDYLCKPVDTARLEHTLDQLADLFFQKRQIKELEERLLSNWDFHGIVGKSPAMLELFDMIQKVARHFRNVLVLGPTGCGKELVARALHEWSPLADKRFVVCNCSALVDTLLESQLFGYVRGAFTGATDTRPGLFEYADGGTVFLDEIGEMALPTQAKLLRVIENREIQRVGSPEVRKVDVRLIAASNRELRAEVLAGRFREDLFYRLSSIQIRVPGLAERLDDIPLLVQHFIRKCNDAYGKNIQGLTRRARALLMQHSWPGNVRELENVISSASITATSHFLDVQDLPEHLQRPRAHPALGDGWQPLPLSEVRRQHIQRVLEMCSGNRVRASEILGIGRTSLYRFLKREAKRQHDQPAG